MNKGRHNCGFWKNASFYNDRYAIHLPIYVAVGIDCGFVLFCSVPSEIEINV